ncbi:phosphonoacetaldehyde hydrolase [Paenibacillus sp. SYP-B3998]|uniref:Phosphonoacetaldehyde hydrolase n=1 Tax=Paenibacillus sp. SYP-B3998 TaxID=2678564 RepID=A0A6G4A380_9BACL|nr:phosphonoacetaldehyde hydrolase [Paenibacillus sp. SYP-B3998]NEW08107.1 phosphonoacetaldehyde hydrolase [Paenibacillus sp. SYP-B3998]
MIQAVVFDWAGTMVDYGCFAPLNVFMEVFRKREIAITIEEARAPMGLLKRDHIREILRMERVAGLWQARYGELPQEADVDALYADFEPMMLAVVHQYAEPIPGALALVQRLREQGIRIGSTTGYTAEMMAIVTMEAKKRGYSPDHLVTPNDVPAGRPYPWMMYKNATALNVYPMSKMVKVGDTVSDVQEGVHAGAWTVGVVKGGSELGMSEEEVATCGADILQKRMDVVATKFRTEGAHYVIDTVGDLDAVIELINQRIERGERP